MSDSSPSCSAIAKYMSSGRSEKCMAAIVDARSMIPWWVDDVDIYVVDEHCDSSCDCS